MTNAPDLGHAYLEAGHQSSQFAFAHVRFEQISRVGPELYSICTNLQMEVVCAVSYDLDATALEQLLACLPPEIGAFLRQSFAAHPVGPMTLNLPPLAVDLTARLGEPQQGDGETFVPFLVTSVRPASEVASIHVTADPSAT